MCQGLYIALFNLETIETVLLPFCRGRNQDLENLDLPALLTENVEFQAQVFMISRYTLSVLSKTVSVTEEAESIRHDSDVYADIINLWFCNSFFLGSLLNSCPEVLINPESAKK